MTDSLLQPAQTNLALYEQLRRDSVETAVQARRAYELAAALFAGRYRASGKTFIAHLVGTASIVAALGERPPLILAGLLHAVYAQDVFGSGRRRTLEVHRAEVRAAAGAEAEALVHRYTALRWTPERRRALAAAPSGELDRDVLVVRLANEVEERVDLGATYAGKPPADTLDEELAAHLGLPRLAGALAEARRRSVAAAVPPELRAGRDGSYLLAPRSHRERLRHAAVRAAAGLLDRLRR